MQTQPQISFDDLPVDEAVREAALDHIAQLERMSDQITGCHVVVAQPHRHHREGRLYSVRVDVVLPGGEIVVNRNHPLDHAHEDVFVALRDSFDAARRRLEDHVRHLRGAVKRHVPRAEGRVTQIFPLQGYGFIETPDGREIYFHRHALSAADFRAVDLGTRVHFVEEEGDEGPQAAHVEVVHGAAARGESP
ncbi:MAG: HPF/RaiA family ribosome-associated protein [Planctomycetia bacterium]|nr:HPF/RaiA family ribosome-associated protein [Planctomycetia bacterium]